MNDYNECSCALVSNKWCEKILNEFVGVNIRQINATVKIKQGDASVFSNESCLKRRTSNPVNGKFNSAKCYIS